MTWKLYTCNSFYRYDLCVFWMRGKMWFVTVTGRILIKRPARDACLCMGDLQAPPAPHFVFLITL